MDSRNVPKDIATGAGSFWLWLKEQFDEKATISRGEAYISPGPSMDPMVRRSNDDVTIVWSSSKFCQMFSLRHFNGGPSTSDLEKMARARIARHEYPPEDPVEEDATGPPALTLVESPGPLPQEDPPPDLTATHEEYRGIVAEGREEPNAIPRDRPDVVFPPDTLERIDRALMGTLTPASPTSPEPTPSRFHEFVQALKKLDALHEEYDALYAELKAAGLEIHRDIDGRHSIRTIIGIIHTQPT